MLTEEAFTTSTRGRLRAPRRRLADTLSVMIRVGPTLIITDKVSANLRLGARNIPLVEVVNAASVNTYQLVRYPVILVTEAGMKALELRLQGGAEEES